MPADKYCELYVTRVKAKIGFVNPQIRSSAAALQYLINKEMTAEQFKNLLGVHGISCTDVMPVSSTSTGVQP